MDLPPLDPSGNHDFREMIRVILSQLPVGEFMSSKKICSEILARYTFPVGIYFTFLEEEIRTHIKIMEKDGELERERLSYRLRVQAQPEPQLQPELVPAPVADVPAPAVEQALDYSQLLEAYEGLKTKFEDVKTRVKLAAEVIKPFFENGEDAMRAVEDLEEIALMEI